MRIAIVTDAWHPQINGVVRTLSRVKEMLEASGHDIRVVSPAEFHSIPCPTYPEIPLALFPGRRMTRLLDDMAPEAIHIPTEGPLGMAARRYCLGRGLHFTTAFHTRFPEYLSARTGLPPRIGYSWLRRFHRPSSAVMVATQSLTQELESFGFTNLTRWSRGVDTALFHPSNSPALDLPRPVFLYVGRVAIEKNIESFLEQDLPGSKVVVGDGPQLAELQRRFPDVHFTGAKTGEDLARHYASGDVFVFPSRTDTFGLVMLEALASGLPVAAYPVPGPLDVINGTDVGVLDENLGVAARKALHIPGARCRDYALGFSWDNCAEQFASNLVSAR